MGLLPHAPPIIFIMQYSIPGSNSKQLLKKIFTHVGTTHYGGLYGVCIARGEKSCIYDVDNNKYIDLLSGGSVMNLGYSNKEILDIYHRQASTIPHTMFVYSPNEEAFTVSKLITEIFPFGTTSRFAVKTLFGLSGSDANDAAIKCARKFTGKKRIISFKNGWHGSTGLAQQANGFSGAQRGVFSKSKEFLHLPFPSTEATAGYVVERITKELRTQEVAAVLIECVQGDGGNLLPHGFILEEIALLAKSFGAVFIVDEVQSGNGRTGKYWASEHFGFVPDIITTAKGVTAGYYPFSVCMGRSEIIESLDKAQHIYTFSANPVACAIATHVIGVIRTKEFLSHVQHMAALFRKYLVPLKKKYAFVKGVRGYGLQMGLEIIPQGFFSAGLLGFLCAERGVYPGYFGAQNEVLRIHPPLTISAREVRISCEMISDCVELIERKSVSSKTIERYKRYAVGLGTNK